MARFTNEERRLRLGAAGITMFGKRVAFVVLGVLIGCGRPIASVHAGTPADDVVVTTAHWLDGVKLRTGETMRVPAPVRGQRWTVVTPRRVLRLLTPADRVETPDAGGWRFEALAPGSASVTFTGFPARGGDDQPNPPKFVLDVTVQ